jgi:hypothetical protein
MTVKVARFGPGTLKLGTTPGTDFSCQVQSMGLNVEKDQGDTIVVLCGDSVPGGITYTYVLAGTVLQDLITAGLSEYSWTNAGKTVDFDFTPLTGATSQKVVGKIVMDPISIGTSDGEFGDVMTADVEWSCVGKPTVTWATVLPTGFAQPNAPEIESEDGEQVEADDDERVAVS